MTPVPADLQPMQILDAGLRFARARLGPDITAQRLLILISVAFKEGLSQRELMARLDATSAAAMSRNLAELSEWSPRKTPGLGLIELRSDRFNLRRKQVFLTAKGRRFMSRWRQHMQRTEASSDPAARIAAT